MRKKDLFLCVFLLALGGCVGKGGTDWDDFSDANDQITNTVTGSHATVKRVTVPSGATEFLIKARYQVAGELGLRLVDPSGDSHNPTGVEGSGTMQEDRWFFDATPQDGVWRLEIAVDGSGSYGFGFYWREADGTGGADQATGPDAADDETAGLVALSGGLVVAASAAGFLATEIGRYKFLRLLALLGLFTRLEKDDVLAHERREQLYTFIKNNPGPSFSDLMRELELSNGTLVHHLRILESQEYIKPIRDGFRTRFYLRGPKITPVSYLTRTQQHLLDTISSNPGVTQKELSKLLGLPRESISYHTKRLASQGRLMIRQEGKWRRYFSSGASPGGAPVEGL